MSCDCCYSLLFIRTVILKGVSVLVVLISSPSVHSSTHSDLVLSPITFLTLVFTSHKHIHIATFHGPSAALMSVSLSGEFGMADPLSSQSLLCLLDSPSLDCPPISVTTPLFFLYSILAPPPFPKF